MTASGVLSGKSVTQTITAEYYNSSNYASSCAITNEGQVYCWGNAANGQLGNGTTTSSTTAVTATLTGLPIGAPTVTFGTTAATNVVWLSSTLVQANVPAGAAGTVSVKVTNFDGQASTLANSYTYISTAPSISTVSSNQGTTAGGNRVKLAGSNLGSFPFTQISLLGNTVCMTNTQAKGYCFGENDASQTGTNISSSTTTKVPTLTPIYASGVLSGKSIAQIAEGDYQGCALTTDNGIYCWGGSPGNGSSSNSAVPVAVNMSGVLSGKTITQIASGGVHSCALTTDNGMYCWGQNGNGELGNNSTANSYDPVAVTMNGALSGKTITQMSLGEYDSCALTSDGLSYCWGQNGNGQLGNNSTTDSPVPVAVNTSGVLSGKKLTQIAAHYYHTCAIDTSGLAYCWGKNTNGQLGNNSGTDSSVPVAVTTSGVLNGKNIKQLTTSVNASCALTTDNGMYCWGNNDAGQLGNGTWSSSWVPVTVTTSGTVLDGKTITQIVSGWDQACALTNDGLVSCWGDQSSWSSLGNGVSTGNVSLPAPMLLPAPTVTFGSNAATDIIPYSSSQLELTTPPGGSSWATTNVTITNADGQSATLTNGFTTLGTDDAPSLSALSPTNGPRAGGTTVNAAGGNLYNYGGFIQVSSGSDDTSSTGEHTCGVAPTGLLYCWGRNDYGQLGNGSTTNSLYPRVVNTASNPLSGKIVTQVAAGIDMTCALTADNGLYCWGRNDYGQLGNGSITNSSTPVAVKTDGVLSGKTFRGIYAGHGYQVCVVTTDNNAYCWGGNSKGEIGNNSTTGTTIPVAVQAPASGQGFLSLSIGPFHTCGVSTLYQAYCWGGGDNGQLGTNSTGDQSVPTAVFATYQPLESQRVTQTATAVNSSCAVTGTGFLSCWGDMSNGRLGNGSTSGSTTTPVATSQGSMRARYVVGSQDDYCAIGTDNGMYCWGANSFGSHATNDTTQHTTPTGSVLNGSSNLLIQVSLGRTHACEAVASQLVACAGNNSSGQLGDGTTTSNSYSTVANGYGDVRATMDGITAPIDVATASDISINVTSPAHAAGTVDFAMKRQDGRTATLTNSYTYNKEVPGAPTGLATTPANNAVALSWTAPSDNGGAAITDYKVEYSSDSGSTWSTFSHTASTATTQTVTGLSIGTTYTFRVSAVNSVGTGSPSSTATGTPIYITAGASSSLALSITPASSARLSSNYQDVTVTTNAPGGYILNLSTSGASQNLASGGTTIGPSSGTLTSPLLSLNANTWGYRVDGIGGFGTGTTQETNVANSAFKWAGIQASGSPDTIKSQNTAISNDTTRVWYAASIDATKPSGTYSGTVVYTVVSN